MPDPLHMVYFLGFRVGWRNGSRLTINPVILYFGYLLTDVKPKREIIITYVMYNFIYKFKIIYLNVRVGAIYQ